MDGPMVITFGVELEFYVRFKDSDYNVPNSPQLDAYGDWISPDCLLVTAVQTRMIKRLRECQIAVNDLDAKEENYKNWTVATDSSIQPSRDNAEYYTSGLGFAGIEVKSPALAYSPDTVYHVLQVIATINEIFETRVNYTTSFQVHVGNDTADFPFQTLKNFASLTTVFQRQIHSIHTEERLQNGFCVPPGMLFRHQPPLEIAKFIQKISSFEEFLKVFLPNGSRFQAYNFENLIKKLKTIEFRQHEGTMDCSEIGNYIHLVCGLVCASHHAGPAGFTDLIVRYANNANDEQYSFVDLLKDLTLDRLIQHYSTRLQTHPRLSHEWHKDLKIPASSPVEEEGSHEAEDNQHPASTGSPEFEIRPKLGVTNPDSDIDFSKKHENLKPTDSSLIDWGDRDEAKDNQHLPWMGSDSPESEPRPKLLRVTNPHDSADSPEEHEDPVEWRNFDWSFDNPENRSSSVDLEPRDEAEFNQYPPYGSDSPGIETRPTLRVANPDNDDDSP